MKYAQLDAANKVMVGVPRDLPSEWKDGSGATIYNFNQLPRTTLAVFGWLPVESEEAKDGYSLSTEATYDEENARFVYKAIPVDVGTLISDSESDIDDAASDACKRYISSGVGQDMRYMEKESQAERYVAAAADGAPTDSDYPMIAAEAEACGMSVSDKAKEIVAVYAQWVIIAGKIEGYRISGKKAIKAMTTVDDIIKKRDEVVKALGEL